jgi:hypothetical protein
MRRGPVTPEELAIMKQCVDDGWSLFEMRKTYGWHNVTVKKYFPDAGWTVREGAKLGAFILHSRSSS